MSQRLQLRRDTAINWTTVNPTLGQGEQGYELDTGRLKVGDGVTAWGALPYQPNALDLGNATDPAKGSALLGFQPTGETVGGHLGKTLEQLTSRFPQTSGNTGLILAGIDSLTDGAGASTWRSDFKKMLRGAFGDCGPGYHGFSLGVAVENGNGFGKTGGVQYVGLTDGVYGQYSLDGNGLYVLNGDGVTDNFSWNPGNYWTTARVYYLKQPGGGSFKVREDSNPASADVVVFTANPTIDLGFIDVPYSGFNWHGLYFSALTGNVCVFGAMFTRAGSQGVYLSNVATGGRRLQDVAAQNSAMRVKWFQALQPSHYLLNGGMNDRLDRTPAQHAADLTTLVTDIQTASPTTNILMVQSNEPVDHATSYFDAYYPQKVAVALAKKLPLLDLRRVVGNYAFASANGRMVDGIHPNAVANPMIAAAIAQACGIPSGMRDPGQTGYPVPPGGSVVLKGSLTDKKGAAALATPVLLWRLGMINGFPTAVVRTRIAMQRNGTGAVTVRDIAFAMSNGAVIGNVSSFSNVPTSTLVHKEAAGDAGAIEFSISLALVNNKLEVSLTATGYAGAYYATADYVFTNNAQAGTAVIES